MLVPSRWDYFIVHSRKDADTARALYAALTAAGARVFWDGSGIREADNWVGTVRAAQLSTRCFLVLVTRNLATAHFAQDEILTAIDLQRAGPDRVQIVPVLLETVSPLPYGLSVFQCLDARGGQPDQIATRLLTPADEALPLAVPIEEHELHAYPRAGFAPSELVTMDLLDALSETVPRSERRLTVDRANAFRRQADADEPDLPVIRHGAIAPDDVAQGRVYWSDVLHTARINSPRMLAAVLLSISDATFPPRARADRERLLAALRALPPIG